MSNVKRTISDWVLRRAENNAHYKTNDLHITGFNDNYDTNSKHEKVIFDVQMSFYNQRYDFIKKHITNRAKILEIGDVNGFNIEYFGNDRSLSINFVDFSYNIDNRFEAMEVNGGIYVNETFVYGMIFETLEHLHNPMLVLNQMLDICSNGVFLSIPYVRTTTTKLHLGGGHVFEFSPNDLKKIFNYYGITVVDYTVCNVLKLDLLIKPFKLHSIIHRTPDELFGVFEKFQLYYVMKKQ